MLRDGWTETDLPAMDDRTVVVTGANSGIGYEASRAFAARGANVVMACRSVDRGADAVARIREENVTGTLDVRELDLADLASIADFATEFAAVYDELDVLCNNAGVMAIPYRETADGFEYQFGVNHLGHFALTGHLLDALRETDDEARVVTQSSAMHTLGDLDGDVLAALGNGSEAGIADEYGRWDAYARSKLANLQFAYELDRRLAVGGREGVTSVACHPGYAATDLQYRGPQADGSRVKLAAMRLANALFAQSPARGALPLLYAAVEDDVDGGDYIGPGGLLDMRGAPEKQRSSDASYDADVARKLWDHSRELTDVAYDLPEP